MHCQGDLLAVQVVAFKSLDHSFPVNNLATGGVDEPCALLHARKHLIVKQALGPRVEWGVDGHHIALAAPVQANIHSVTIEASALNQAHATTPTMCIASV